MVSAARYRQADLPLARRYSLLCSGAFELLLIGLSLVEDRRADSSAQKACYFFGLAVNMWIITPLLYFGNFWNARSYDSPMAAHLYNSTFGRLDVSEILNRDLSLNEARFAEVGPIRLTPYFALSYGVSFAVLTAAITTVFLWHWDDIKQAISGGEVVGDIHVASE